MTDSWPKKIRRLRKARGLTQQQAADLIGYHWVTISRWENDNARPNEFTQERYVDLLRGLT